MVDVSIEAYFFCPDLSLFQNDLFFFILSTDVDIVRLNDFCLMMWGLPLAVVAALLLVSPLLLVTTDGTGRRLTLSAWRVDGAALVLFACSSLGAAFEWIYHAQE